MTVLPYLFLEGRCADAIAFYQKALGAELLMQMRFDEAPPEAQPKEGEEGCAAPGNMNGIMHASLRVGQTMLFLSDGQNNGKPSFQGFSLCLSLDNPADADRYFNALLDDGQAVMPLGQTFFSPRFGMVTDKFGLSWMIFVEGK